MYLNLIQVAESFGVSEKVVDGWVKHDGLPFTPDRDRNLFDSEQVAQWASVRGMATTAGFLASDEPVPHLRLGPLMREGKIWRGISPSEVPEVFERIIAALPGVTPPIRKLLDQRILMHGGVTIAPVGGGYALPHPRERLTLGHDSGTIALLLLSEGLKLEEPAADDVPVRKLFFFISPTPRGHFDILANLSRGLRGGKLRSLVDGEAANDEIFHAFDDMDKDAENGK
jgi:nitrogen PTS system EIIA component